ncbi:glycosyltransferase [Microbacterium sp. NPDC016588]
MSRNPLKFARAFRALGRALSDASSLSITGADIMDGGYNPLASMLRWRLALAAQESGIPTRILGFSWNGRAPHAVTRAAARAADAGVEMFVRDPVSRARMAVAGIAPTRAASDTVFCLTQNDADTHIHRLVRDARSDGQRIALVNASALVAKRVDQPTEYRTVLKALRDAGYLPVLLPHVDRGADGDVRAVRLVDEAAPGLAWQVVPGLLRPAQIRSLLTMTDVVVTGRMHLSIMALSIGVPAFVISTQGKVEGLSQLFESPELLVSSTEGLGAVIANRIADERLLANMRDRIASRLPVVLSLSAANFEGLAAAEAQPTLERNRARGIRADAHVSVVIPTHNRAEFLPGAVGSVLAQTRMPREIIVCSDVHDEASRAAVAELGADAPIPVRYEYDPQTSGGASASRNAGARLAEGDVLAFLDDDDLWEPGYLEAAVTAAASAGADMAVVGRWMVKGDTRVPAPLLEDGQSARDVVAVSLGTTGSNMVMTRESYLATGGFDESIPVKNDTDFFFRFLLARHSYVSVADRLVLQIKHGTGQLTGNTERRAKGTKVYMRKHAEHLRLRDRRHLRLSYYRIRYHLAAAPLPRYGYLALALMNYSPRKYLEEREVRRAWIELEGAP